MNQPPQQPHPNYSGGPTNSQPSRGYRQPTSVPPTETLGSHSPGDRQSQPTARPRGFLYSKPFLLSLTLLVLVLGAFTVFQFTHPSGPPTNWLATETVGKQRIVYYLHWNDDNGVLRGSLESSLFVAGVMQNSSWSFVATYDSQTTTLHITFDKVSAANLPYYSADAKINGDTLTIKRANNSDPGNDALVFHPASAQDYTQAKNDLEKK